MSRVVRALHRGPVLERAEFATARQEADAIVQRARTHAERIVAQAQAQAAAVQAAASAAGLEQATNTLATRLLELERAHQDALAQLAGEVSRLALSAARHLVAGEVQAAPEFVARVVAEVIAPLRRARTITIIAHPDDCAVLRATLVSPARVPHLELREDARIVRGGCVVRSEIGTLDARVETRLDALAKLLAER